MRGVALFLGQEKRQALCDGRARAEAAKRLRQLAAQRAAADHQQAARQLGQVEYVFVGQKACLGQAGDRRRVRTRAGGDQCLPEAQFGAIDRQRIACGEVRFAEKDIDTNGAQTLSRIEPADAGSDATHALHHCGKVDADIGGNLRAVVLGIAHLFVKTRGPDDRFRRDAADVQAAAAEQPPLDERDLRAHRCRYARRDQSRRPASDDHQIVAARRLRVAPWRRVRIFRSLPLVCILRGCRAWDVAWLHLNDPGMKERL